MTRLPKLALVLVALTGVIAAGCSSGTPSIKDPNEVITKSVTAVPAVKSLHLKLEVSGKVNISALTGGSGGLSNIDLAGTTLEGDLDVTKIATDLKLAVPGLLGTTGEIIVVDGYMYTKISLQGDKFSKSKLSDTVPVALPSAGAVSSADPSAAVASLQKALDDAGAKATLMADEKVAGKDAYHVSISLPIDKINGLIAADGGSTTAGMKLDTATLDYWVYKDGLLPAKMVIAGSAATLGNLNLVLTLSDYGKSVSISAPADSEISG